MISDHFPVQMWVTGWAPLRHRAYTTQAPTGKTAGEERITQILRQKFEGATFINVEDISGSFVHLVSQLPVPFVRVDKIDVELVDSSFCGKRTTKDLCIFFRWLWLDVRRANRSERVFWKTNSHATQNGQ